MTSGTYQVLDIAVNNADTLIALIVESSSSITVSSLGLSSKTISRSRVVLALQNVVLSKILIDSEFYIGFSANSIQLNPSTSYSTPNFSLFLISSSAGETCQQFPSETTSIDTLSY
jgi:hypothetical protein